MGYSVEMDVWLGKPSLNGGLKIATFDYRVNKTRFVTEQTFLQRIDTLFELWLRPFLEAMSLAQLKLLHRENPGSISFLPDSLYIWVSVNIGQRVTGHNITCLSPSKERPEETPTHPLFLPGRFPGMDIHLGPEPCVAQMLRSSGHPFHHSQRSARRGLEMEFAPESDDHWVITKSLCWLIYWSYIIIGISLIL